MTTTVYSISVGAADHDELFYAETEAEAREIAVRETTLVPYSVATIYRQVSESPVDGWANLPVYPVAKYDSGEEIL